MTRWLAVLCFGILMLVPPGNEMTSEALGRELLIVGQSHIGALGVPIQHPKDTVHTAVLKVREGVIGLSDPWPRNATYWNAAVEMSAGRDVVVSYMGQQDTVAFLFKGPHPVDFISSHFPDLPLEHDFDLVPESLVREQLLDEHTRLFLTNLLRRMVAQPGSRVLIIGSPAPKKDEQLMRARLRAMNPDLLKVLKERGQSPETVQFSPPAVRLKAWGALQDDMAAAAQASGAKFFPFPAVLCTEDGFLKPEYYHDIVHMNTKGGAIYFNLLLKYFGGNH